VGLPRPPPDLRHPRAAMPQAPRWRRELGAVRTDWTREEVSEVYHTPFLDLVHSAATVHRMHHDPSMVQRCTLLSIKTGGCPETCTYCSQSSSWSEDTGEWPHRVPPPAPPRLTNKGGG